MEEKLYQLALNLIPGLGGVIIRQLISYCGSASAVFSSNKARLIRIQGIGDTTAHNILSQRNKVLEEAEQELKWAEKHQVQIIFYTDSNYPERLRRLYDSPALLYYQGAADLNAARSVGIVGTRQASEYGKGMTEEIVQALQKFSPLVISGLAYGIDIAAHRSCLKHQLATVGVMATGSDIIYPSSHQKTAQAMLESGGLLTENRFGTKPDSPRFPARNRIIAGLSDVLIVVEAASKGGALITAEYANNYHKEVFAVPGDVHRSSSVGCNRLIHQNKAAIYTGIQDIEELVNWGEPEGAHSRPVSASHSPSTTGTAHKQGQKTFLADSLTFTGEESQVIALLRTRHEMLMDDLSWQTQIPVSRLASLLLSLEFQGVIKALPGKKFVLS
jgi:DNA processing protein